MAEGKRNGDTTKGRKNKGGGKSSLKGRKYREEKNRGRAAWRRRKSEGREERRTDKRGRGDEG